MKKPLFPIVLSQFIKLILLLLSLQLSLISYAHADGIHFNSIKYFKDYGYLAVGDSGLAAYSADGLNWKKITLPGITPDDNLVQITHRDYSSSYDNPDEPETKAFTLTKLNKLNSGKYISQPYLISDSTIIDILQPTTMYSPGFNLLDEIVVAGTRNKILVGLRLDKDNKQKFEAIEQLETGGQRELMINPPLIVKHVTSVFSSEKAGGAILTLESPRNGAPQVVVTWNKAISHTAQLQILSTKYQLQGGVYDGFAGESYVIDVAPDANGTINAYKLTPAGQPILYRTVHTGRALSESGVVAAAAAGSKDGGLVLAATDANGDGVEVVAEVGNTMKATHLSIAARTCAYIENNASPQNEGMPNLTIFLGKDKYALVSTDGRRSWRRIAINGL